MVEIAKTKFSLYDKKQVVTWNIAYFLISNRHVAKLCIQKLNETEKFSDS